MPVTIEHKKKNKNGGYDVSSVEYLTVAERLAKFHEDNADTPTSIVTEIKLLAGGVFLAKAIIKVGANSEYIAHASEKIGSTFINTTSALENAETSAVGRALAMAGYIGSSIASAEEVANAIKQQAQISPQSPSGTGSPPVPAPVPAAPPNGQRPGAISAAQVKLVIARQIAAQVKDDELKAYLIEHFNIQSRSHILKGDLDTVLAWIASKQQAQVERETQEFVGDFGEILPSEEEAPF